MTRSCREERARQSVPASSAASVVHGLGCSSALYGFEFDTGGSGETVKRSCCIVKGNPTSYLSVCIFSPRLSTEHIKVFILHPAL